MYCTAVYACQNLCVHCQMMFESTVAKSVGRGGATTFRRDDLLYELTKEQSELRFMLRLEAVDTEYHAACATTAPSMECEVSARIYYKN
jgi:wyosine [tRNA(Phe)-imidazoG37] synthetase (radical SAM superfamily)